VSLAPNLYHRVSAGRSPASSGTASRLSLSVPGIYWPSPVPLQPAPISRPPPPTTKTAQTSRRRQELHLARRPGSTLRCPTSPPLPANVPGHSCRVCRSGCDAPRGHHYPPMCLALPPCSAARTAMPRHDPPNGLRCPTVPRLPANVPGTPAMFCRSGSDAPRRHDYPPMCLATPAMFCRSGSDAPRCHDYPPMCLATPAMFCRSCCDAPRRSRLPANVPGTPAMFCRSDRDAPRRHDYPPMCLATPAVFHRSGCDAGATMTRPLLLLRCPMAARHDDPQICLARLPYRASASAMQEQSHASGPNKSWLVSSGSATALPVRRQSRDSRLGRRRVRERVSSCFPVRRHAARFTTRLNGCSSKSWLVCSGAARVVGQTL
jgi:hypothetical protein